MDSTFPKIFVIILNFNGADVLPGCLTAVFQSDYPNFETVIIDNASKDGSFEKARLNFSRAHFIKNSANVGFAKGNNVGIRYALEKFADYVFILNNDALVEKNTLSSLVTAAENSRASLLSPLILAADNKTVWFAGGLIDWKKMRAIHLIKPGSANPYLTQYLTGCALLVKKEVFKKIGLLDERFFLYYEDADFSLRAKKAGFELAMIPAARVQHLEKSNTNNNLKTYWLVFSGLLFFQTHASMTQKLWLTPYFMLRRMKNFYDLIFAPTTAARDVHKAYRDYKKMIK